MTTILVLAAVGILALLIELIVPGAILGIAGGLCLLAAVVMTYVEYGFLAGAFASVALVVVSVAILWGWMRHFHRFPFTREMILETPRMSPGSKAISEEWAGQIATCLTDLGPSGRIQIGSNRLDAIAESEAIPRGSSVVILRPSGSAWVVRKFED